MSQPEQGRLGGRSTFVHAPPSHRLFPINHTQFLQRSQNIGVYLSCRKSKYIKRLSITCSRCSISASLQRGGLPERGASQAQFPPTVQRHTNCLWCPVEEQRNLFNIEACGTQAYSFSSISDPLGQMNGCTQFQQRPIFFRGEFRRTVVRA